MAHLPTDLLAMLVARRRAVLGLKQDDLAERGGPKVSTVSKIERGAQDRYSPRTRRQLEKALGWEMGSLDDLAQWLLTAKRDATGEDLRERMRRLVEMDAPESARPLGATGRQPSSSCGSGQGEGTRMSFRLS